MMIMIHAIMILAIIVIMIYAIIMEEIIIPAIVKKYAIVLEKVACLDHEVEDVEDRTITIS